MKILSAVILFFLLAAPARAADIAIALTEDLVEVDAGFAGAKVVLFGALTGGAGDPSDIDPSHDIVAVVRGPALDFTMRPMLREQMIWIAGPAILINGAPGVLLTTSTRPLDEIATPALRRAHQLDANALDFAPLIEPTNERAAKIITARGVEVLGGAFLSAAKTAGLFQEASGVVSIKKGALFSLDIELPPTTPVGDYAVDIYLIREGVVISQDSAQLSVRKVGIERGIYELAHTRPIAYGIGCVAISLAAGWLAAAAFRKSS